MFATSMDSPPRRTIRERDTRLRTPRNVVGTVAIVMSTATTTRRTGSTEVIMATSVAATISTVLPGFLVGAISVQAIDEFGVSEARYGWGLGSFFLAATAGSAILGRTAQRFGPRRLVLTSLLVAAGLSLIHI